MSLQRKTPIRKKAAKKRRKPPVTCSIRNCKRRPSVTIAADERYCKTHATRLADRLTGDYVKRVGVCLAHDADGFWHGPYFTCAGPLNWAHLVPRGYRAVRWNPDNAVSLCASHHRWFDLHPIEREDMIYGWLGTDYDDLRSTARAGIVPDLADVITEARRRLADG